MEQLEDYLNELSIKTNEEIFKTITSENTFLNGNLIKRMVSKNKIRWEYEGFNLDLAYITKNIIAMGFPASRLESFYRNDVNDVKRFFEKRHPCHYKVYNLCSEKNYPEGTFYRQGYFPFNDHEAPPIDLILPFCIDLDNWLSEDTENVAAIHCKAGKGRTGTFISCYLVYSNTCKTAKDALTYFGKMRTKNGKGVTIPSQIRYTYYFEHIMKISKLNQPKCKIRKIKIITIPNMVSNGCYPFFKIVNYNNEYCSKIDNKIEFQKTSQSSIEFTVSQFQIAGDVSIKFFNKKTIGKDKMFSVSFHTNFLPNDGVFIVKKSMLDVACKDKENKIYDPNIKLEIHYVFEDFIDNNDIMFQES